MLTAQDVHAVRFERGFRGYRADGVDRFLDKAEEQLEADTGESAQLAQQIAELEDENRRLAEEIESYRADGESMKAMLINAQRLGENVIREANQRSEEIIRRASAKSDGIIREANELLRQTSEQAEQSVSEVIDRRQAEEREYERIRLEIARFKADVLELYRCHVESLSQQPACEKDEMDEKDEEQAAPAHSSQEEEELLPGFDGGLEPSAAPSAQAAPALS